MQDIINKIIENKEKGKYFLENININDSQRYNLILFYKKNNILYTNKEYVELITNFKNINFARKGFSIENLLFFSFFCFELNNEDISIVLHLFFQKYNFNIIQFLSKLEDKKYKLDFNCYKTIINIFIKQNMKIDFHTSNVVKKIFDLNQDYIDYSIRHNIYLPFVEFYNHRLKDFECHQLYRMMDNLNKNSFYQLIISFLKTDEDFEYFHHNFFFPISFIHLIHDDEKIFKIKKSIYFDNLDFIRNIKDYEKISSIFKIINLYEILKNNFENKERREMIISIFSLTAKIVKKYELFLFFVENENLLSLIDDNAYLLIVKKIRNHHKDINTKEISFLLRNKRFNKKDFESVFSEYDLPLNNIILDSHIK